MQINLDPLILSALREDMPYGDITTNSIFKTARQGKAQLWAKQDGIIAGLFVFKRVFELLDEKHPCGILLQRWRRRQKGPADR